MKRFDRALIRSHYAEDGQLSADFIGSVRLGETFVIETMDDRLHASLQTLKKIFKRLYPNTVWNGRLEVEELVHNAVPVQRADAPAIATLFSLGVDSMTTSLSRSETPQLLITARVHYDSPQADTERFVKAEAMFALWDMQARERNFTEAVVTARALSHDFPDNRELVRFIARHGGGEE